MGLISDFEDRLEGTIEGAFSGLFKSPVQPAELARACSKEMGRSKKLGVGKIYVSNVYSVLVSSRDAQALSGLIPTLQGELETYLLAYSREHDFQMTTRPIVRFYPDRELKLGRFEVIGDLLSIEEIEEEMGYIPGVTPEPEAAPQPVKSASPASEPFRVGARGFERDFGGPAQPPAPAAISTFAPAPPVVAPTPRTQPPAASSETVAFGTSAQPEVTASLTIPQIGVLSLINKQKVTIGRQDDNDIFLSDINASRHHAQLEREGLGWIIVDLGSTNGTLLNGRRISRTRLNDGDHITIGTTEMVYHEGVRRS